MAYSEKFERAVAHVLSQEGGYVKDPDDPGGETKYGISKRSYPNLNIKGLTKAQAIEIYHRDWWERYRYEEIEPSLLATKVFSFAVNMGASRAHKLLQQAVNMTREERSLVLDGIIGIRTIEAIYSHDCLDYLLSVYMLLAIRYYVSLKNQKYLAGWINRALDPMVII